ncbi:MAG: hypothetical protein A3B99_04625 [Candidatus Yanofskybacteria bacterium RIFCSPHIGHO2_02_FULL_44_12b]|uniref:Aldehyde dehydrogenase domain-containing protein n=2 Tax=Candidatus Yanofskyibacteriota TaxID=1752733 RepID=A0A1F8GK86_9BACT|nr:MAG: Succinate-semialdehyde dehydrogenase (NAD(P)+) [Candidatus Yanofskybacteria bacterium GW2011_GWA2_44_9]OGN04351.1 MAG: hypothetical protein A2659_03425 [Candidatus Yanofskybacteria bacterium RIFCSPHIGHO2_01_FULL_44_24]OGN14460.1 MAG: hypothetical protein A3B99_04625 [Candidatus Yanofskybacteria bacterium RIFCSPHIGHO2_02_FULL_44_12b]OGN25741.1 MAG: hypothetical protein A2925_00965 [Candidatus Yanofskybacteria bacterium RIFCSPLOWO2_01_FULL_44_22]
MATLKSVNPSNYQVLGEVRISTRDEIMGRVMLLSRGQKEWADLSLGKRVKILRRVTDAFAKLKSEFALLESQEMGMPLREALADYDGTLDFMNWYLDNAEKYLGPETTFESETEIHQVFREPLGVAGVIIPWNYPFLNFAWSTFQSLIVGNAVILKHSEECPLSGQFIEAVMHKCLPSFEVFAEVYGGGDVGRMLVNEDINLIHFVGSCKTGKTLYKTAADKFIRAVMELGGSAPGIIFDDADIDSAVNSVCEFRLANAGQYCDGLKRLIVHRDVFNEVVEKIANAFSARRIGMAEYETTELGPLVSKRQLDLLVRQVRDAKVCGAKAVTGGDSLEKKMGGAFHQPTVLTDVTPDMLVWKQEVFGPVLPILRFGNEDEAVRLANDTSYGLGAYVYTANKKRATRVARQIQSGMVSINGTNYTTPWNPFGGYKGSGMGREHGKFGFHEVTQPKVVARNK